VTLCFAGCTALPPGPFERAEAARLRGDLTEALLGYDQVPVQHPHYPEARAAAAAVERRLRRSQELLLQGILLRGEWREDEALTAFEQARDTWPGLPGIEALIAATHSRRELFRTRPHGETVPTPTITTTPEPRAAAPVREEVALAPVEPLVREPLPAPVVEPARDAVPPPTAVPPAPAVEPAPAVRNATDPSVFARLMAIEERLQRGQVEAAIADLAVLQKQWPDEPAICTRLGRLLHQRAMLRYGQGALPAALSDWRRVRELCPDWNEVRDMLRKAESETAGTAGR
jgi:tetratricopeptide (TPR) repeat protein